MLSLAVGRGLLGLAEPPRRGQAAVLALLLGDETHVRGQRLYLAGLRGHQRLEVLGQGTDVLRGGGERQGQLLADLDRVKEERKGGKRERVSKQQSIGI